TPSVGPGGTVNLITGALVQSSGVGVSVNTSNGGIINYTALDSVTGSSGDAIRMRAGDGPAGGDTFGSGTINIVTTAGKTLTAGDDGIDERSNGNGGITAHNQRNYQSG